MMATDEFDPALEEVRERLLHVAPPPHTAMNGSVDKQDATPPPLINPWPTLDNRAYHGVIGEFVRAADPYTEADPVAVLSSTIVMLGTLIGRGPHMVIGNDRHGTNLNVTIVGKSSHGGKGTSKAVARDLALLIEPGFAARMIGGFGSGEIVVDSVRNGDPDDPDDAGVIDKRLLVVETELSKALKIAGREGSILSQVMREAWDGQPLEARSRTRTSVSTGHHVGVLAHIVQEELFRCMGDSDIFGGYANRFMWLLAKRSKRIAIGGTVPAELIQSYAAKLRPQCEAAAMRDAAYQRSDAAARQWIDIYDELCDDEPPGRLGAAIARGAPICSRLALFWSMMDGCRVIDEEHDQAAYALWRYARESAAVIFADPLAEASSDPKAAKLFAAIQAAGSLGLNGAEQHKVFHRSLNARDLETLRKELEGAGLIETTPEKTAGRTGLVSRAVPPKEERRVDTAVDQVISAKTPTEESTNEGRLDTPQPVPPTPQLLSSSFGPARTEAVGVPLTPPETTQQMASFSASPGAEELRRRLEQLPSNSEANQVVGCFITSWETATPDQLTTISEYLDGLEAEGVA